MVWVLQINTCIFSRLYYVHYPISHKDINALAPAPSLSVTTRRSVGGGKAHCQPLARQCVQHVWGLLWSHWWLLDPLLGCISHRQRTQHLQAQLQVSHPNGRHVCGPLRPSFLSCNYVKRFFSELT